MTFGMLAAVAVGIKRSINNWRLWVGVYLVNFIFAAVLTLPIAGVVAKDVSKSLDGTDLMGEFNVRWYTGFLSANGEFLRSLIPQAVFVLTIYALVEVFFAGGFYSSFSGKNRMKFGEFLYAGGSHFLAMLFVAVMEIGFFFLLYEAIGRQFSGTGGQVIAGILLMIIILFADFVRAAVVIDNDRFWSKVKRGISFTVRHPLSTVGIYLCCMSISVVMVGLFYGFHLIDNSTSTFGVFLEIIIAQIFVLLRIFSRLIFYAGEAVLYKENQIEVIKVRPEMLE